jgi:hypothetical protein
MHWSQETRRTMLNKNGRTTSAALEVVITITIPRFIFKTNLPRMEGHQKEECK